MNRFFILVFFFLFQISLGQVRPEIKDLVKKISDFGFLGTRSNGQSRIELERDLNFMRLDSIASEEDLLFLVEDKSPLIRCVAFDGLISRNIEKSTQILNNHLLDSEYINLYMGCTSQSSTVANEFVNKYVYNLIEKDSIVSDKNRNLVKNLNAKILENPLISMNYKTRLIYELEINKENYKLIRKIASQNIEPISFVSLSKYHNKNDVKIILASLENPKFEIYSLITVKEFPEKQFYKKIVSIFESEIEKNKFDYSKLRLLHKTLAKYPNELKTIELFEKTFLVKEESRKSMKEYLWMAITKCPSPKFDVFNSRLLDVDKVNSFLLEEMDYD